MTPAELEEAEALARQTNRSLSGLFREGLRRLAVDIHLEQASSIGRARAKQLGITQGDVVRLTKDVRKTLAAARRQHAH